MTEASTRRDTLEHTPEPEDLLDDFEQLADLDDLEPLDELELEPSPWWRRMAWSAGIAVLIVGSLVSYRQCSSTSPPPKVAVAAPKASVEQVLAPTPEIVVEQAPEEGAEEGVDKAQCEGMEASLKQLQTERKGLLEAATRAARARESALKAQAQAEQDADLCFQTRDSNKNSLAQARSRIKALESEVAALKAIKTQSRPKELIDVIHAYDQQRKP